MRSDNPLFDEDPPEHIHQWIFVLDWEGDPSIPNGTRDCSHWYCEVCDETVYEQPDDFEPDFPEPYED